ncbi:PAP/fibrillin family protein [Cyanobium sp. ATX 6F1]|uniref:PAP/fibrillin family protein n=1 Tax=unclassified Cyanobium TaxID=2627006 RepID=UPI0020CDAA16|nr:PAP/fibrillin family protein [Cyanobium sp. ATX 6F1]
MPPDPSLRSQLLIALQRPERAPSGSIRTLIEALEREQPADLDQQLDQLAGVWELRWSSGPRPERLLGPWAQSLQLLDPAQGRALNVLRLSGLDGLGQITASAAIERIGPRRLSVRFEQVGWSGPRLGGRRLDLLRSVRQSFPAWLDVTVLDQELRICRGNAGSLFALTRLPLELSAFPWPSGSG